jgi:hypothetical protein
VSPRDPLSMFEHQCGLKLSALRLKVHILLRKHYDFLLKLYNSSVSVKVGHLRARK